MTSWNQARTRKLRPNFYPKQIAGIVEVEISKDPASAMKDILTGLCVQTKEDKLPYLRAFIELNKKLKGNLTSVGYNKKDILTCLRVSLIDPSTQVRSAGLKAVKHIVTSENDVLIFNKLLIPHLLARCLDLSLRNESERLGAIKLIRKVLLLSPRNFHPSLSKCLVSLAIGGVEEKDRMLRICLATLCELGVLNTDLFIESRGVVALTRNLLECQTPKIAESLCGVLLHLLNRPNSRNSANVDLLSVATPYCDFHYKHSWKDKNRDERDLRFNCSRLAMLSILRSWPGILHFCSPDNKSGLKAIVDILYLNQLEVRKAVLDLFYELLGLPQPEWTDELSVALSAVDPCEPQAAWRLNEGFVVAEGSSVLPHLAKSTPRIVDMHLAVILYCFYNNGLINALVEVIATSDTFISVRATVLLGELLRLIQIILPPECCNTSPALPTLLEYATKNMPQAIGAVSALLKFHKLLKKRPASYSLYLDYILKSGNYLKLSMKKNKLINYHKSKSIKAKIHNFVMNNGNDIIKETLVLNQKDPLQWNWNIVRIIVKGESNLKVTMSETSHKAFFKSLIDFYLPSNNKYSHMDLSASKACLAYTMVGIELIQFLAELNDPEGVRMLADLFRDILNHAKAITGGKSVHDCLFSPQHMVNTQCQNYFLFVGRLATIELGDNLLNQIGMFQCLQNLSTTTNNDCYVKLIISSMDYGTGVLGRDLLTSVSRCCSESSRLYATQFLLILLRSGVPNFESWAVRILVDRLRDESRTIALSALSILYEACETTECLEALISLPIDFSSLGDKGRLLLSRVLSNETGFGRYVEEIKEEIRRWDDHMVYRYVNMVDDRTSTALTLHQRGDDGKYVKRVSSARSSNVKREHYVPPHLYGQLVKHKAGFNALTEYGSLQTYIQIVQNGFCDTDKQVLELKASIWTVAHFSTARDGFEIVSSLDLLKNLVDLAERCEVYSVRATAYYALGLVGTTHYGADALYKLGWVCTRHNRHESWPIIREEGYKSVSEEDEDGFSDCTGSPTFKISRESSFRIGSPGRFSERYKKRSSTLPNQNASCNHHRSLSESKTYEMLNNYEQKLRERVGLSRQHSNCSNVSSNEYPGNKFSLGTPLSPIPSSSDPDPPRRSERKIRRHSESCRREADGAEPAKPNNVLSAQDLSGYTTLYYIRKRSAVKANSHVEEFVCKSSFSSLSSVNRFRVIERGKGDGPVYMGVSLPRNLLHLFPEKGESGKSSDTDSFSSQCSFEVRSEDSRKGFVHDTDQCLGCTGRPSTTSNIEMDEKKMSVLHHIEMLSNPIRDKFALLQAKQEDPRLFEDVCLYSEACKLISSHYFRLNTRRIIHELFYDLDCPDLVEASREVALRTTEALGEESDADCDFLKLSYKENKFPIKHRDG